MPFLNRDTASAAERLGLPFEGEWKVEGAGEGGAAFRSADPSAPGLPVLAPGAGRVVAVVVIGETEAVELLLETAPGLRIRLGPYEHTVHVRGLSERRGPATVAATLYEETSDSVAARARLAEQLLMAPAAFVYEEKGRPTTRDRRELDRLRDERRK